MGSEKVRRVVGVREWGKSQGKRVEGGVEMRE